MILFEIEEIILNVWLYKNDTFYYFTELIKPEKSMGEIDPEWGFMPENPITLNGFEIYRNNVHTAQKSMWFVLSLTRLDDDVQINNLNVILTKSMLTKKGDS